MGCFHSSINRVNDSCILKSTDFLNLKQSWNIIKSHNPQKFIQDTLIKTVDRSPSLRQFWISKIQVEGNNFDYGQSESCLRTDRSWHIGLYKYSVALISILDKLISVIDDENRFKTEIESLKISEDIFLIEYNSLLKIKKYLLENIREHLKTLNYDFTDHHEQSWDQLFIVIAQSVNNQQNDMTQSTEVVVAQSDNIQKT